MIGEKLLNVVAVSRRFGGLLAVNGFSCTLNRREILGLIGPNGAGKSTIFNLISGFLKPAAGQVFLRGRRIDGMSPDAIGRLGLVRTFQHGSLFKKLSVLDNVLVGTTIAAASARERQCLAGDALAVFGLTGMANEPGDSLPHGYQRLLSMAIAYSTKPAVLCLDEPLTGLNQSEIASVLATIRRLRDEGGTSILFVEHNMRAVMNLCDRIVVIHQGSNLAEGSPAEISHDPKVIEAYLGNPA